MAHLTVIDRLIHLPVIELSNCHILIVRSLSKNLICGLFACKIWNLFLQHLFSILTEWCMLCCLHLKLRYQTLVTKICNEDEGRIFYSLTINFIVKYYECTITINNSKS